VGIYKELMKEKVGLTKNIFRTKSSTLVKYFWSKLATQRKNLQVNGWGKNRTGFSGTFRTTEK